jgi:hypothetical protein
MTTKPQGQAPGQSEPDKRRFPRLGFKTPAEVRIVGPGINAVGYLIDLSEDGVGVATVGALLAVGEAVSVQLPRESDEEPIRLQAMVQYSRGVRYGLKFLKDSDE